MDLPARIALFRHYYSTNNCATPFANSLLRTIIYASPSPPPPRTVRALLYLIQKFEEKGSVADKPKHGRQSLSDERIDAVKETVSKISASNE